MNRKGKTSQEVIDGYVYRVKSCYKGKKTLICCGGKNITCPVKGYLKENEEFNFVNTHSHPPPGKLIAAEGFKDQLWLEVMTTLENPSKIYRKIAEDNPEIASVVTFALIESSMKRWRKQSRPKVPATLAEYANIVNEEKWRKFREYPGGSITITTINLADDTSVTVFGDIEFLASLPGITELHIDATFRICPRNPAVSQFFTIMARIDDSTLPIAWACMSKKSQLAYHGVFDHFHTRLAPYMEPLVVHQDFEIASANAIREVYPNVTVVFCFFHYCQAMYKQLKRKLGQAAMKKLEKWGIAQVFYRKLLALPLLPAADIRGSYIWLKANTPNDILECYTNFLHYYEHYWLGTITPENFSVYNRDHRTNNPIEAYHRVLHKHIGDHVGIWQFTGSIRSLQIQSRSEVNSLNMGLPIRRPRENQYIAHDVVLKHAWKLYADGSLNVAKFLSCANHLIFAFGNQIKITTTDQLNQFVRCTAHNILVQPEGSGIAQIAIEDNFRNQTRMSIIRRYATNENVPIFVLENINQSKCNRCENSILNIVSLPCGHWYACETCTEHDINEARINSIPIFCSNCRTQCIMFKIMQVS